MNESAVSARTSRLARASFGLGVLALFMLAFSGWLVLSPVFLKTQEEVIGSFLGVVFCPGMAVVAALAAFVLGIVLSRASFRLGVLALFMLLLSGCWILRPDGLKTQDDVNGLFWGMVVCQGMAVVAALAAFIVGIIALVDIRRSAGKVERRGRAITGLVTATLTWLTLALMYGVAMPASRAEARKVESSNNLKVLGLAMMIYHECYHCLPPAVLRDRRLGEQGQPYSWRVALLPILGENDLFSQYRRDEPWDSPANKSLLARMPRVFAIPGSVSAADGLTHYQVLVGPGTAFERPDLRLNPFLAQHFPRGAAQTILVVEAADPVPWTKPEDLSYVAHGPLPKVGGLLGNGFHALFADASVSWIEAEKQESALRTLVPLNGR